jgi:hypothetical protein
MLADGIVKDTCHHTVIIDTVRRRRLRTWNGNGCEDATARKETLESTKLSAHLTISPWLLMPIAIVKVAPG